ncbi:DUF3761 domain-containing protein [Mycobacterium sp. RTGN5]|uniref:DUF3761 domain-containing protein n=1 Tax=Mycobacterium sp. RTGN5 TaxID=3016522 RepID=UPI0029C76824|nr:DUF3761 domain-containing protein [Mycobacterium sp. RTGN5]
MVAVRVKHFLYSLAIGCAGIVGPTVLATGAQESLLACTSGYYENSDGQCILDPEQVPPGSGAPPGATAVCKDGSYSFSTHRSGTCSGHHGVGQWL